MRLLNISHVYLTRVVSFGRLFMKSDKYKMSNIILVVHHKTVDEDSMQAFFIEKYVQRKYNLFDS